MSQLRWGLRAADQGWPVFPVKGKHPLVKGWPANATTDPARIREWSARFRNFMTGWGIVTDWDRAVFDVDLPKALRPEFAAMAELWPGPKVLTGRGVHLYGVTRRGQRTRLRPTEGADLKAGGGYVLAPGSLHPKTGRHYVEVTPISRPLPEFPAEVMALLPQREEKVARYRPVLGPKTAVRTLRAAEGQVAKAPPGERNNTLYRAARDVAPFVAADVIDLREAVSHLYHAALATGLEQEEARRTIRSAFERDT